MSLENARAIALADKLRWVLEDSPDSGHRAMIKAATLVLAGLLQSWPAATREHEAACAIGVLVAAAADGAETLH